MKCKKCTSDNKKGAKFCHNCGEKLAKNKVRVPKLYLSPVQKTYAYLEFRIEELVKRKEQLSNNYNTPPTGFIDKILGGKEHKNSEQQIKFVDKMLNEYVKLHDMLGGVV